MKRTSLIILSIFIFFSFSCEKNNIRDTKRGIVKTEGWIDDNTYLIAAIGKPIRTYTSPKKRKRSAKRAAILNARFKVLKKFKKLSKKYYLKKSKNKNDRKEARINAQKIKRLIKHGKATNEMYDREDNCEIIYEIKKDGLKQLVKRADLSSIDIIN